MFQPSSSFRMMTSARTSSAVVFYLLFVVLCLDHRAFVSGAGSNKTARLSVVASPELNRKIPATMFGIFFEEINHAGAGGLWAELVSNRGFESGGLSTPSYIAPWTIIGNDSTIFVSTDLSSCFERNKVALRMDILCDGKEGSNLCPPGGVGVYNPGYWGMNIEKGKSYKVVLYIKSFEAVDLSVSLTSSDGLNQLATKNVRSKSLEFTIWAKVELILDAEETDHYGRLQLTSLSKGTIWLDQISAMPMDTYKGHGFRNELFAMLRDLKPGFLRFPGGCYVEGEHLRNAFRWRESIGPWEKRAGHFGDVWNYWTDDGLGYFEFLQLAEDLNTVPVWVINNGVSHAESVSTSSILPFVQDALDSIEFARGAADSKWGSVRAAMGHPEPFKLNHVAIGNEDCGKDYYLGNYLKFYDAIKGAYADIKIITNCDASSHPLPLDHPADYYDFHTYPKSAADMFSMNNKFDRATRSANGPKAFVSEYAVTGSDAGYGNLKAAIGEAAFLIGLEHNSDVVEMASYAPLFVNSNNRRWSPDSIVFNSWQQYGTPSYWMQHFFKESNGATILSSNVQADSSTSLVASAITWQSSEDDNYYYLRIKVVNFGNDNVILNISISGLDSFHANYEAATNIIMTSTDVRSENSFEELGKVVPRSGKLKSAGANMDIDISPNSITALDIPISPAIKPFFKSSTYQANIINVS